MKKQPAPEQPSSEEMAQFREQLARKIQRLVAESLEAWPTCENPSCRRGKRCASEQRECIAKWHASLPPLSPEESAARMQDFRLAIEVRKRFGGDSVDAKQFMKAVQKEKAARRAAMLPRTAEAAAPAADEPKLSPEQQARIDRAWNDYAAEQEKPEREPGPRITRL